MAQGLYTNVQSTMSGHLYPSYSTSSSQAGQYNGNIDPLTEAMGGFGLGGGPYTGKPGPQDAYYSQHVVHGTHDIGGKTGGYSQHHLRQLPQQYGYPASSIQHYQALHSLGEANMPTPRASRMISGTVPPVPELVEPRRTSWSSNDGHSPQTPTFGTAASYAYPQGQSPAAYSTPSPMSSSNPFYPHIWKNADGDVSVVDFWALVNREPAIPEPVPALRSGPDGGRGTLDKILDNRDGTTNVYVRGLQPATSDEMLKSYGEKFGPVVSCKSIIDSSTGHCKGFGFIKYHNFVDAENCIRGFFHRGYEAKFARKSHNSRLKDLARSDNTNLYISNLPRLINEDGLKAMFQSVFPEETFPHHQAGSCKVLKDSCGVSRGVGFARFESPLICDEIIDAFNNRSVGESKDQTVLQVRFADTEEQKQLKAFTAIKRQFKADEYNEAVYGVPFPYNSPTGALQSPVQVRSGNINAVWTHPSPASSISPSVPATFRSSSFRSRQSSVIHHQRSASKSVLGAASHRFNQSGSALAPKTSPAEGKENVRASADSPPIKSEESEHENAHAHAYDLKGTA